MKAAIILEKQNQILKSIFCLFLQSTRIQKLGL